MRQLKKTGVSCTKCEIVKLLGLLLVKVPRFFNLSKRHNHNSCSQSHGHAHGQLSYITRFCFGVFSLKATSKISTEEVCIKKVDITL